MKVVSNLEISFLGNQKTTTAYNFQHDYAMRGQRGSYAYIQI